MKNRKRILVSLLSLGLITGTFTTLASCGGDNQGETQGTKFALTWNVDDHARVEVEGQSSLPKSAEEDSVISFTVTVDTGYEVSSVKVNNKRLGAKNGKYSTTITKDTTIDIAVSEMVGELVVSSKPTKLVYFAGESVDVAGMVVEVTYATGRKDTISSGTGGYTISPATFVGGETSFDVVYGDKSVTVELDKAVEFLVTIDPDGGTIDSSYLSALAARNLNNYKVDASGVVSFSYYRNLSSEVALPTAAQMSKADSKFNGWSFSGAISNNTSANVNAKASWEVELVKIDAVSLTVEENKPILTIHGVYKAADTVKLHLKEGNKNIELDGPEFKGTKGEEFNAKFDLTNLSDKGADFEGAWMDITLIGSYNQRTETMNIVRNDVSVDVDKTIEVNNNMYAFATYNGLLKVYFSAINYRYTLSFVDKTVDGEEKSFMKFEGTAHSKFANNYLELSFWQGSETTPVRAKIGETGAFTLEYDLDYVSTLKTMGYAHIGIYDAAEGGNAVYGGTSTNFNYSGASNTWTKLDSPKGEVTHAITYTAKNGITYYVGHASWDGLLIYAVDESHVFEMSSVALEEREAGIFYVLNGTVKGYTAEQLKYDFYFQHNFDADHDFGWDEVYNPETVALDPVLDGSNGFKMEINISNVMKPLYGESTAQWVLTPKIYLGGRGEEYLIEIKPKTCDTTKTFTKDGIKYGLRMDSVTWQMAALTIEKAA